MHSFEDKIEEIDREIEKRRYKWQLKAIAWMDFDDVAQEIRIHIYEKWPLWDQGREFLPWVNTVISRQITNKLRNLYMNIARPCVGCHANEGDDRCRIFGKQCAECPLFAKWQRTRKNAYDVKLPLSIEKRSQEVFDMPDQSSDVEAKTEILHVLMKDALTSIQYRVYKYLFIENKTEEETAILMDYKSGEQHRNPGYKQIGNLKKIIIEKAKKVIARELY
jgi:DNA-directed RNA polymerase specialized sigma24 family protein